MRKKKSIKYIVSFVILFLVGIAFVNADDSVTCDTVTKGKIRQAAANIKANYIVEEEEKSYEDEYGGTSTYADRFLVIKIYNVVSGMYLTVSSSVEDAAKDKVTTVNQTLYMSDIGADGAISIKQDNFPYLVTYEINVYASIDSPCSGIKLRTINVTLPKYNTYSNLDACDGFSDYYLCQEYITFDIDGKTFFNKLDEYKAKVLDEENGTKGIEDSTTGSDIVSSVSKNKYWIVGIIIVIGVILTIVIVKKKQKV